MLRNRAKTNSENRLRTSWNSSFSFPSNSSTRDMIALPFARIRSFAFSLLFNTISSSRANRVLCVLDGFCFPSRTYAPSVRHEAKGTTAVRVRRHRPLRNVIVFYCFLSSLEIRPYRRPPFIDTDKYKQRANRNDRAPAGSCSYYCLKERLAYHPL